MKAFRGVKKTRQAPNEDRFHQKRPADLKKVRERLRFIAQGLKKTGRNLADATPNTNTPKD